MTVTLPDSPTQRYPFALSTTENAILGSRTRFDGHRRPTALLMTISSPSTVYQTTAARGAPSGSIVEIVANRRSSRKARTSSEREAAGRWLPPPAASLGSIIGRMVRDRPRRPLSVEAFPGTDPYVEPILRGRQGAGPSRVEGARRLIRKVEVDRDGARFSVATEIRPLGRVNEVAARGIRLDAVRCVTERDEEAARVTRHPEDRKGASAVREAQVDAAEAAERERLLAAVRQLEGNGSGRGGRSRLDRDGEPECWIVIEMMSP